MSHEETNRLETFSDGVMAIIITIMAFSVRTPLGANIHALRELLPEILVYVLSFVMIAIYWNNHHHLMRATEHVDAAVMWANIFLLFWLSLFPFVTSWVGRYPNHYLPAASYGVVSLMAGGAYWILGQVIIRVNGRTSKVGRIVGRDLKGRISIVLYALGTALAFWAPVAGYLTYGAVALLWFTPDRRFLHAHRREAPTQ